MSHFKIQLSDTHKVINNQNVYNYRKCIAYLLERGKAMYGGHFLITNAQKKVFYQILLYAIEDHQNLGDLDLKKGLLLMGESGVGKTAMMHLCKPFFPRKNQYEIKSCRTLAQEFSHKGFDALIPLYNAQTRPICLDNMGKEFTAKHYGNSCEVIYNIVEHYYERRFDQKFPKLHLTTSLSPQEIENKYGIAFRKMLQELFNVIICE